MKASGNKIALLLAGSILCTLFTGCGARSETSAENETVPQYEQTAPQDKQTAPTAAPQTAGQPKATAEPTAAPEPTPTPEPALYLHDYKTVDGGFIDGYLWTTAKSTPFGKDDHYACVDMSGQVTAAFPMQGRLHPAGNGYAYLESGGTWTVIDAAGNIHSSYAVDNDNQVYAYGDGYIMIFVSAVGFNASGYNCVIYDPEGTVLVDVPLEEIPRRHAYYGKGVFRIDYDLWYFVESGRLETIGGYKESIDFSGSSNWSFFYETTSFARVQQITCFDTSGNQKVFVPEDGIYASEYAGPFFSTADATQGKRYYFVDAESCTLRELDADYAYRSRNMGPWQQSDKYVALPMKGDDGYHYISLFDDQWNILMDPVRVDFGLAVADYQFADGILLVWNDGTVYAYNEQGQEVFTLTEDQCMSSARFSGGALILRDETVIDRSGSVLFKLYQIDASQAVILSELP